MVIEIDSPGGLLEESKAIANRLRHLELRPDIAYVPRERAERGGHRRLGLR